MELLFKNARDVKLIFRDDFQCPLIISNTNWHFEGRIIFGSTGISPNNMRSPSPECYTTFWMMTTYSVPSIDRTLHQFFTITEFDLYLIVQGFHRTYATGAACQQRTLTPPDTWSCPTLGLACVLMLRPIFSELVLSPDLWISNTPRYFSFAYAPWTLKKSNNFQCPLIISITNGHFELKFSI